MMHLDGNREMVLVWLVASSFHVASVSTGTQVHSVQELRVQKQEQPRENAVTPSDPLGRLVLPSPVPTPHPKIPLKLPPEDTGRVTELQAAVDTDHFGFSIQGPADEA